MSNNKYEAWCAFEGDRPILIQFSKEDCNDEMAAILNVSWDEGKHVFIETTQAFKEANITIKPITITVRDE